VTVAAGGEVQVTLADAGEAPPAGRLKVEDGAEAVAVDTGVIRARIGKKAFRVLDEVAREGKLLLKQGADAAAIDEIVDAAAQMKDHKTGALMVIERDIGLREYIETGPRVEARVSASLLVSLFTPPGPLHDGAVVITSGQVVAAGCTLPLSEERYVENALGMRHRAGLGVAPRTLLLELA
jgi:DNA integrity scanning protein DisA with diadenylate cyclase activity